MPGDVLRGSVQPDLVQGRPCTWTAARFTKFIVDPWGDVIINYKGTTDRAVAINQ